MIQRIAYAFAALALVSLASCQPASEQTKPAIDSLATDEAGASLDSLLGKTLRLDYGQLIAEVTYGADTLHWKTFTPELEPTGEGDELPAYQALGGGRYFISWMEADGTSVSQLLDLGKKTLDAYLLMMVSPTAPRKPVHLQGSVQQLAD